MDLTKTIVLSTFKLEEKKLSLINCDFKSLATIMATNYPMSFHASNVKIIDFQNVNRGFIFDIGCDYEGATTTGEILFEKISFEAESALLEKLKTGSFISSTSPANITIRDSVFRLHHRSSEDFDIIQIKGIIS
jgi:hypothetical protein